VPDLRQQRDSARTERDQLRRENAALRAITGDLDPAFAEAYSDLCDIALHGLHRPDDLGGPVTTGHAESRPPQYDTRAYNLRSELRRDQRKAAAKIRRLIERIDDPKIHPPVGSTTTTPLSAQPSQTSVSPTSSYGTISPIVRRAPSSAPNAETA
jgi:hypothetical protein